MFSRLVTFLPIAALVAVAIAAPDALEVRDVSQCNTSDQYCCDQKFSEPTKLTGVLGGILNPIVGVTVPVGLTCTPISIIGVSSAADCTEQPTCCTKNTVNGVVNIVCSPIAVNV